MVEAERDATVPQGEVETDVKRTLHFPLQVGVGITHDAECGDGRTVHRHHTIGLHQLHGVIGADTSQAAREAITDTQLG